jgi:SAM-dependent methyltransferase
MRSAARRCCARAVRMVVPQACRPVLRRIWAKARYAGTSFRCSCCRSRLSGFLAHGQPAEPQFLCPVCRSKPPHRLAALLFDLHPEWFPRDGLLLHVAPEEELKRKLRVRADVCGMTYHCGGITGTGLEYLDLLDLPMEDQSVDLIYCCHVLNMVQDDFAAMREVRRVLRPAGVALLQVPAFYAGETTLESVDEEDRQRKFSDPMMYRCYTDLDYVHRLNRCGFRVERFLASHFDPAVVQRHQLKQEVLHACYPDKNL